MRQEESYMEAFIHYSKWGRNNNQIKLFHIIKNGGFRRRLLDIVNLIGAWA